MAYLKAAIMMILSVPYCKPFEVGYDISYLWRVVWSLVVHLQSF